MNEGELREEGIKRVLKQSEIMQQDLIFLGRVSEIEKLPIIESINPRYNKNSFSNYIILLRKKLNEEEIRSTLDSLGFGDPLEVNANNRFVQVFLRDEEKHRKNLGDYVLFFVQPGFGYNERNDSVYDLHT